MNSTQKAFFLLLFFIASAGAMQPNVDKRKSNDTQEESVAKSYQIDFDQMLIDGITQNDSQKVCRALRNNAHINGNLATGNNARFNPLDYALQRYGSGSPQEIIPVLLEDGTVEERHYASDSKQKEIIKILLENGAVAEQKQKAFSKFSWNPHLADILELLIRHRIIPVTMVGPRNRSMLYLAIANFNLKPDLINTIQLLLESGANPNRSEDEGRWTPLSKAISNNNFPIVQLLLQYGADPIRPRITNKLCNQAHSNPAILKLLLEHGAGEASTMRHSISSSFFNPDLDGYCNAQSTKLLLKHGAHPYFYPDIRINQNCLRHLLHGTSLAIKATANSLAELLFLYGGPLFASQENAPYDYAPRNEMIKEEIIPVLKTRLHPLVFASAFENNHAQLQTLINICKTQDNATQQLANAVRWAAGRAQLENVCHLLQEGACPKKALTVITGILTNRFPTCADYNQGCPEYYHFTQTCTQIFNQLAHRLSTAAQTVEDWHENRNFLGKLLARTIKLGNRPLTQLFLNFQPALIPSLRLLDLMHARTFSWDKEPYSKMKDYLQSKLSLVETIVCTPHESVQTQLRYGATHRLLPDELGQLVQEQQKHTNRIAKILLANAPINEPMQF